MKIHKNNLSQSSSPYLLQHKDNPVHWQEWSTELLKYAQQINKPLLVSIGYAACHWCHVMEHESFEDESVAQLMNEHFICIKVDREERPDIDYIYMEAIQILKGSGGWPLNAFALPDGRPFMAGTYFPKSQWKDIIIKLSSAYHTKYDEVLNQADQIANRIKVKSKIYVESQLHQEVKILQRYLYQSREEILSSIDQKYGGFGNAPKFPLPTAYKFLLAFNRKNQDNRTASLVELSLDSMAIGGIYDQVGGGFSRYSVDNRWHIPHFEKMLYDNGQLLEIYALAYKYNPKTLYKSILEDTIAFLDRELSHPEGAYYASINADSEGIEGKFYVWTSEELKEILTDEEYDLIQNFYNITEEGNWENNWNVPFLSCDIYTELNEDQLELFHKAKLKLFKIRSQRIFPTVDDKIILAWNALAINGIVHSAQALRSVDLLNKAEGIVDFIEMYLVQDNQLFRSFKDDSAKIPGFLDDYAIYINALINLYESTFKFKYLERAKELTHHVIDHFSDPHEQSNYFNYKSNDQEKLISNHIEMEDNVIPSSNSFMAMNLLKLSYLYDNIEYYQRAKEIILGVRDRIASYGIYYSNWATAAQFLYDEPYELCILGERYQEILLELQTHNLPNVIFAGGNSENLKILKGKLHVDETFVYICKNKTCGQPLKSAEAVLNHLK